MFPRSLKFGSRVNSLTPFEVRVVYFCVNNTKFPPNSIKSLIPSCVCMLHIFKGYHFGFFSYTGNLNAPSSLIYKWCCELTLFPRSMPCLPSKLKVRTPYTGLLEVNCILLRSGVSFLFYFAQDSGKCQIHLPHQEFHSL